MKKYKLFRGVAVTDRTVDGKQTTEIQTFMDVFEREADMLKWMMDKMNAAYPASAGWGRVQTNITDTPREVLDGIAKLVTEGEL